MFEPIEKGQQSRWKVLWPDVDDLDSARAASSQGMWACLIVAALTGVIAAFGALGLDAWAFADSALFLGAAWGIKRASRVAAVGALTLFLIERAVMFAQTGRTGGLVAIFFLLAFGNGARGTFAIHRLAKSAPPGQQNSQSEQDSGAAER